MIGSLVGYLVHFLFARALWGVLRAAGVPVIVSGAAVLALFWFLRRRGRRA